MKKSNKRTIVKLLCAVLPLAAVAVGVPHVIRRYKIRKYAVQ
ncbi:hypothetical protein [Anaerocolumna cellulosilytica]|nr:hypothetical protein [Anaerocolumna cellulosilytica]MBB5197549.1 hypothetical protein [Anaerocolumna cellulosilytica]